MRSELCETKVLAMIGVSCLHICHTSQVLSQLVQALYHGPCAVAYSVQCILEFAAAMQYLSNVTAVQELADERTKVAELQTACSQVADERQSQSSTSCSREQEAGQLRIELAERSRQMQEVQGRLAATVSERDQALTCVSDMQSQVSTQPGTFAQCMTLSL